MARPVDWQPLADHDPVPGDTATIRDEARRMADIGSTIRDQVRKLRSIGKDGTLKGQYAEKLRSAAGDLAGKLDKTAGRYEKVSGHLRTWADELDHAQRDSITALDMAKEADRTLSKTEVTASDGAKKPEDMTPQERQQEQDRKDAYNAANGRLQAARTKLRGAVGHRDTHEAKVAKWIREAIDDDVEDSWWDNVKDFVDKHAKLIKVLTDILSWIATAVAIISMFIPGLNVLVFLVAAGILVVLARSLLAATGNASWMEVVMDSIGLVTLGAGRIGMAALKGANTAVKGAAVVARRGQVAAKLAGSSAQRQALGKVLSSRTASAAAKRSARAQLDALKKAARHSAPAVPQNLPSVGRLGKVLNLGDTEGLSMLRNVGRIADRFPGVSDGGRAGLGYAASVGANWAGTAADLGDKALGNSDLFPDKPYNHGYNDWKGSTWQKPVGSTW